MKARLISLKIIFFFFTILCSCESSNNDNTKSLNTPLISIEKEALFKNNFKNLAKKYVQKVQNEGEVIISFGVFTDCDITGFVIHHNTQEGIERSIQRTIQYKKENPEMFKDAKLDGDPWSMPEWITGEKETTFDFYKDERFNICSDIMEESYKRNRTGKFLENKNKMFDLICASLQELKTENAFGEIDESFILLAQECDNGVYGSRKKSLSKILSSKQLQEYISFCDEYYSY
jgi:hypothetical protein